MWPDRWSRTYPLEENILRLVLKLKPCLITKNIYFRSSYIFLNFWAFRVKLGPNFPNYLLPCVWEKFWKIFSRKMVSFFTDSITYNLFMFGLLSSSVCLVFFVLKPLLFVSRMTFANWDQYTVLSNFPCNYFFCMSPLELIGVAILFLSGPWEGSHFW